ADIELEPTPSGPRLGVSGRFTGSLDGAPVEGETEIRVAADAAQITGTLKVSGLKVNRDVVPLPPELESFAATVDAQAVLDPAGQPLGGTLRLALSLAKPRLSGAEGTEVSAAKTSLPNVQVNLSTRAVDLGAVTVDAPMLVVAVRPDGI